MDFLAIEKCSKIFYFTLLYQWGSTALVRAAENGNADCLRLLLDTGAEKLVQDSVRVDPYLTLKACVFWYPWVAFYHF
jgi:hypothetical protein